ncbi:hypothetical protein GQR58_016915 [Nymphon striatum]|nr:hypothetical protein GQR58_016915 [Nymphon striatum]
MNNECYKKYTLPKTLGKLDISTTSNEGTKDGLAAAPVRSLRSSSTPRPRSSPQCDIYKTQCAVCGFAKHHGIYDKYRISETNRAQKFLEATVFLQDDIYTRSCDLQDVNGVFGADLYCHKYCINRYIQLYGRRKTKNDKETPISSKLQAWSKQVTKSAMCFSKSVSTEHLVNTIRATDPIRESAELIMQSLKERYQRSTHYSATARSVEPFDVFVDRNGLAVQRFASVRVISQFKCSNLSDIASGIIKVHKPLHNVMQTPSEESRLHPYFVIIITYIPSNHPSYYLVLYIGVEGRRVMLTAVYAKMVDVLSIDYVINRIPNSATSYPLYTFILKPVPIFERGTPHKKSWLQACHHPPRQGTLLSKRPLLDLHTSIHSDGRDRDNLRRKIALCFDLLNPDEHPPEIVNVVTGQASARNLNLQDLFSYELAPVPTSMFKDSGAIRFMTDKVKLKRLQVETSVRTILIDATVIDESALLWIPNWPTKGTVAYLIAGFKSLIEWRHGDGQVRLDVFKTSKTAQTKTGTPKLNPLPPTNFQFKKMLNVPTYKPAYGSNLGPDTDSLDPELFGFKKEERTLQTITVPDNVALAPKDIQISYFN